MGEGGGGIQDRKGKEVTHDSELLQSRQNNGPKPMKGYYSTYCWGSGRVHKFRV